MRSECAVTPALVLCVLKVFERIRMQGDVLGRTYVGFCKDRGVKGRCRSGLFIHSNSARVSGRWSTAARCRATWSAGSVWLGCHRSAPWGLQIPAPRRSLLHTPPAQTNTHSPSVCTKQTKSNGFLNIFGRYFCKSQSHISWHAQTHTQYCMYRSIHILIQKTHTHQP